MRSGLLSLFLLLFIGNTFAQSPGIIIRPAAGAGATPLNPDGNGFSSKNDNGFVYSDITQSEVPCKIGVYVLQLIADNVVILNQKIQKVR